MRLRRFTNVGNALKRRAACVHDPEIHRTIRLQKSKHGPDAPRQVQARPNAVLPGTAKVAVPGRQEGKGYRLDSVVKL